MLQYLEIPSPVPRTADEPLSLTYDPEWLAITRVFHPFLSLEVRQKALSLPDHLASLVREERKRMEEEGLLVPTSPLLGEDDGTALGSGEQVRVKGAIQVDKVQRFRPTAPAHGQPGGSQGEFSPDLLLSISLFTS